MSAKDSLLATLNVLRDCLKDAALIDTALTVEHNLRASMLRQGLAVLVFATMESFIRERTGELLRSFSNPQLVFSDLLPPLQRATTIGALDGIRFRLKLQPAQDKINWLVGALAPVATATSNLAQLSTYSFGQAASNLVEDDVSDILKAFGVHSPWVQITELSRRLGVGTLDCQSEFVTIKERRHDSAHALSANVLHPDLEGSLRSALAICIGFDLLLSHAQRLTNDKLGPNRDNRPAMKHVDVQLVFVAPKPGSTDRFIVRKEQLPPPATTLTRSLRILPSLSNAVTFGRAYAGSRKLQLVVLDSTSTPTDWATW
ncbi:hypothetical protein QYH69_12410 [Paraburkholderia sp. SARCC-3016]|uniref:hypothetical protein n=1 Tax=Paraburkholderia sp. SARCC-3016 TaxID=3058611 RepID=UPI002806A688|nr:hypothetical protein [Paraburkholderia sp. SARCC-3016]MDQ7978044.1 hypothetical protein [Paraburkholderia sp. SARCC-3016]